MNARLKKTLKVLLWITCTFALLFIAGEITLRFLGHQAWAPQLHHTKVEPGGSLFQPDPLFGYRMRPGKFSVTLEDRLSFSLENDERGYRLCPDSGTAAVAEIWIFGCSFTYGWGVNDSECWPARLSAKLKNIRVRNFAVPGYGNLHSLLQLKQLLNEGGKPDLVVLAYGGFHDQRNVCSRHWRKALAGQPVMQNLRYPRGCFGNKDSLCVDYSDLSYDPWWLSGSSALVHYFEQLYNHREENDLQSLRVTKSILLEMQACSHKAGARFVVAGISREAGTLDMLEMLRASHTDAIDISAAQNSQNCILPGDLHPNAKAHQKIMENFLDLAAEILKQITAHP